MSSTSATVVMDCGAETCKVGYAGHSQPARTVPNCAFRPKRERRLYLADQIDEFVDFASILYRRPFDRGYMVNAELENDIWERIFGKHVLDVQCAESTLLLSEPPLNFAPLQRAVSEMVFEKFNFASFCRATSPFLASWANPESFVDSSTTQIFNPSGSGGGGTADCGADDGSSSNSTARTLKPFDPTISLFLDSGFSFSHAVPIYSHYPLNYAIRRSNIGGKVLTNFLKETVSYRHYNMMDEFYLVNQIKEKLCYVSMNFRADMMSCQSRRSAIRREYILPNGSSILHGFVKGEENSKHTSTMPSLSASSSTSSSLSTDAQTDASKKRKTSGSDAQNEQSLPMNNERIVVPELLFHPNDVGIEQAGLPELVKQAIDASPADIRPLLYANIFVAGGNANLPNFGARLERELRALAPADCDVRVFSDGNPTNTSWRGASRFALDSEFPRYCVTRAEYQEHGENACIRRFGAL